MSDGSITPPTAVPGPERHTVTSGEHPAVLIERAAHSVIAPRLAPGQRCEIVRLLVAYLAPAAGPIIAEGSIVRHGRTIGLAEVWVRDQLGTGVAKGVVTYHVMGDSAPTGGV
jgi:acyl-coenzyme A thioesterase PaaI-like protein